MKQLKRHILKRPVCDGLESGHPWVFRDKVGDDRDLVDGDWLQLTDPGGAIVGTGVYQAEGGVAIRVFRMGHRPVTVGWLKQQLENAIERRSGLDEDTNAYRVINGESDGFPGIVVDVYAGVGVLQTYAPGVDALGRYLAGQVADRLGLSALIWKTPSKRVGGREQSNRLLRGSRPYVVKFHEGPLELAADLFSGQKSGTYLDLRGLRRNLLSQQLRGKKVLNLFAYTGMAGLACALAGAKEVVNVDQAQPSLDFGRRYHKHPSMRWVAADVFDWINEIPAREYDLIISDPPSMASNKTQVIKALKAYHRLYSTLLTKLKPGGTIVACCCTSRISPREFEDKVSFALRPMSRKAALPMEIDHLPAFAEADYLKVLIFRQDDVELAPTSPRRTKAAPSSKTAQSTAAPSKAGAAKARGPAKPGGPTRSGSSPGQSGAGKSDFRPSGGSKFGGGSRPDGGLKSGPGARPSGGSKFGAGGSRPDGGLKSGPGARPGGGSKFGGGSRPDGGSKSGPGSRPGGGSKSGAGSGRPSGPKPGRSTGPGKGSPRSKPRGR
jgi:23S rRNA (cytosine1962-C5)-methyltransferase